MSPNETGAILVEIYMGHAISAKVFPLPPRDPFETEREWIESGDERTYREYRFNLRVRP